MQDPRSAKFSWFDLVILAVGVFILVYFFPDTFYGGKLK